MLSFNAQMRLENLHIQATQYSPEVIAEADTGLIVISGDSLLENPPNFFQEIFDWLDEYMLNIQEGITLEFKMHYFNTGTSARFYELLKKLKDYKESNKEAEVVVNWYYEATDDIQLENGVDLSRVFPTIVNLIPVKDFKNFLKKLD